MLVARPALGFSFALRASRCFRTGPDGRIALTTDWPALLEEARAVGTVAVQTRHPRRSACHVLPVARTHSRSPQPYGVR